MASRDDAALPTEGWPAWLTPSAAGAILWVHAVPGARRSEVAGTHADALRIRLAAPAVDGKANAELTRLLAELLGLPKSRVAILSGQGGRRKRVELAGMKPGEVVGRIDAG